MEGTGLALKIGSLVLGLGTFLVLFKQVKQLKKYGVASLFYIIITSALLACSTLFLYLWPEKGEFTKLILAQLFIVAIAILHLFLAPKLLPWYSKQPVSIRFAFILSILLFTFFFTNLSFTFLVRTQVEMVWHLSSLWFLIPVLLDITISRLLEVPPKQFKKWQYPVSVKIEDPTDREMENPVVISFIFRKSPDSAEETTFRAKAPQEMKLGRLFYFFINDYNSRHPEGPVSFFDMNNNPHQWTFFKLKNKFFKIKTPLDPDESIANCRIKENDILICTRDNVNENLNEHESAEQEGKK